MANGQQAGQILLVFDFDHTLIEDNVDVTVRDLSPGDMPQYVQSLEKGDKWTEYMGAVFQHLHKQGVSATDIKQHVENLALAPGMRELFDHIGLVAGQYDTIIISDANSVFISYVLEHNNLSGLVSHIFTNPAEYNSDGCLVIERYHTQDWCPLSTVNMCKGHILQEHIKQRLKEGVSYSHVIYIGDGSNDLCPGLTLKAEDYLLARKGFSLWKKLEKMRRKPSEARQKVTATVIGWDSAVEIRTLLENIAADKVSK
ncbi:pyridoxal phosphate phosphatase PHOSPHO2-like isoform X2 [Babylonia areolata]